MSCLKKTLILSKSRASLVGGVIGDCIGEKFEGCFPVHRQEIVNHIDKVDKRQYDELEYTDDTAMARQVAKSLIFTKGKVSAEDMAIRFTEEYLQEPYRGYGGSVGKVFKALNDEEFKEPFGPASRQFDGSGSYGNGSAMRIGPAGVFGHRMDDTCFDEMVKVISKITHSHKDAINGAILLAVAVRMALCMDPTKKFCQDTFINDLYEYIKKHEMGDDKSKSDSSPPKKKAAECLSDVQPNTYCYKLQKMKQFLHNDEGVTKKEVVHELGNTIAAIESVPAAIYSFLKAQSPIEDIQRDNAFERTIIYAISLGGDTDTIASMAGALAGAYYGMDLIPESWQKSCEGVSDAIDQATKLFELNYPDYNENKEKD